MPAAKEDNGTDETPKKKGEVDKAEHPALNAFMYSLDVVIPLIDFHQAKHWFPRPGIVRAWMWFQIGARWILTSLLLAGLTGLVK